MVKWNTLDVFFGKRDVDPGAVVLPYRSARPEMPLDGIASSLVYRFACG